MKKVLSLIMATAIVASMSVTAFAAAGDYYNSDLDSGFATKSTTSIFVDGIVPDTTFYYSLGDKVSDPFTTLGTTTGITGATVGEIADKDNFKFNVDKDTNGKMIKSITVVSDKKMDGNSDRGAYIKIVLNDSTTTSEIKSDGKITFKAKKAVAGKWASDAKIEIPYTLWINNTEKKNDEDANTGDRIYFNPEDNETNSLVWGDDRAALKFDANDDASKFYARLSTKSDSEIYATYGDPQNADLWFYDFVGNPTIPSTSRATLTLGIPWDEDDDYVPNVSDVFIYEKDADGVLTDVTDKFTYSDDATDIEGWSIKTRTLGTYIISDTELALDTAATEETSSDATAPTTDGGKEIPNTGSSDMVNVAVVAAVVSLAAAGAVAFRKVK
ncbi:LPXTG cell wall anchor domain-containing protein [Oscillospiraceae bacterium PP1C4]